MIRAARPPIATSATRPLRIPEDAAVRLPDGAAVPAALMGVCVSRGGPRMSHPRTLCWDPAVPLRLELVPAGFNFLAGGWHVAAPLYDYNHLAFQHGTLEERQRTMEQIHDLRVPLYETRALFLRRCPETEALLEAWARERQGGGEERLAFQRALWQTTPLILPLPITWVGGKHP